jgi:hypothetical protein
MGIVESRLDTLVEEYGLKVDEQVDATLARSRESNTPHVFLYMWRWLNLIAGSFVLSNMETDEGTRLSH